MFKTEVPENPTLSTNTSPGGNYLNFDTTTFALTFPKDLLNQMSRPFVESVESVLKVC